MENVSEELKNKAVSLGLCGDWTRGWEKFHTLQSLINKYKSGLQWSMEHRYPDLAFVQKHFYELAKENDIFIDGEHSISSPSIAVCRGKSKCHIIVDGYAVSQIWVGEDADVDITVADTAICFVHLFNKASVCVENNASTTVNIFTNRGYRGVYKSKGMV